MFDSAPPRSTPRTLAADDPDASFTITLGSDLAAAGTLRSVRLRLCLKSVTPLDEFTVQWDGDELAGEFDSPVVPGTWQHWNGLHFWVTELATLDRPPQRGRHKCTVFLQRRNPQIEEGITIDFVE